MTKIRNIILLLLILTVSSTFGRTWTATSGHKTEGDFVKLEDGVVHIALTNGKTARVKLERLSDADRKYVKMQAEKEEDSPFEIDDAPIKPKMTTTGGKKTTNVTVEGIGSTFEAAKKDAFRNAISEVVGTIVDAETRIAQEQVLEQILTASNAYVEEHKIVSQKQEGGLWHVKMDAVVESRALQMRLGEAPVTTNKVDGTNLLDRFENKTEAEAAPILLLAKVIRDQNFPYSVMEASAVMLKDPVKKEGDNYVMQFEVTVKPNVQKFDEFRNAIEPVLEKIAISKKASSLKIDPKEVYGDNRLRERLKKATDTIFVHINTTRNKAVTSTGWNTYELPNKAVALIGAYACLYPAAEITLHSDNGNMISSERIGCFRKDKNDSYALPYSCVNQFAYCLSANPSVDAGSDCLFYKFTKIEYGNNYVQAPFNYRDFWLAPFFCVYTSSNLRDYGFKYTCFKPEIKLTTTMILEPDELKAVKSIKCAIVSQNPNMDQGQRAYLGGLGRPCALVDLMLQFRFNFFDSETFSRSSSP